jgi:hypothetical protein
MFIEMHSHTRSSSFPLLTVHDDIIDRIVIFSSNPKIVLVCKTLRNRFSGLPLAGLIHTPQRVGEMMAKGGRADLLAVCLVPNPHVQVEGGLQLRANQNDSHLLYVAAKASHADVCKLLMDPEVAGIEFRARANSSNSWALRAAAHEGHADVCKLLMDPEVAGIEFRAQANFSDSRALWSAAHAGHADVCKLLMDPEVSGIEFRALANSVNSRSLRVATKAGHADVCKLLMDPEVAGIEFMARENSIDSS